MSGNNVKVHALLPELEKQTLSMCYRGFFWGWGGLSQVDKKEVKTPIIVLSAKELSVFFSVLFTVD